SLVLKEQAATEPGIAQHLANPVAIESKAEILATIGQSRHFRTQRGLRSRFPSCKKCGSFARMVKVILFRAIRNTATHGTLLRRILFPGPWTYLIFGEKLQ